MLKPQDFLVRSLGECRYDSPLNFESTSRKEGSPFVADSDRVRLDVMLRPESAEGEPLSLEIAGPRQRIFFQPDKTTAAIVTCGGLSPGLNNVIRSAYYELFENYGVKRVLGIRNGYLGLNPESGLQPISLTKEFVEPIDKLGGTVLASSRGPQEPAVMADFLQSNHIDILLCVGGDGTQRGAHALSQELKRRGSPVAAPVVCKSIV